MKTTKKLLIQTNQKENPEYALAYEQETFVILVPNGKQESAKLYGNWDEAIISAKRLLTNGHLALAKVTLTIKELTE